MTGSRNEAVPKWNRPFLLSANIYQYSTVSLAAMMKVQMPFQSNLLLYLYQTGSLADVI